jgi:hypothetical protein
MLIYINVQSTTNNPFLCLFNSDRKHNNVLDDQKYARGELTEIKIWGEIALCEFLQSIVASLLSQ